MNRIFWVLCLTLYPAIASATNFDVCVNEAKANHNDTTADDYTSYKCEGTTAEKLSARPDECAGGGKPPLGRLIRKSNQLDDGFYSKLSWTAGKCGGSCEMRSYDSKDTTYLCEVRVYSDDVRLAETGREQAQPAEPRPAANDFKHRRRLPQPGPGWSPPPPPRYSHYGRPSFVRRSWFDQPPPPEFREYEYDRYWDQRRRCNCD